MAATIPTLRSNNADRRMQHQIRISDFGIALSVVYILKLDKDGCYMLTFILFIVNQQIEGMSQKYPSICIWNPDRTVSLPQD